MTSEKVLCVDDSRSALTFFKQHFVSYGFDVMTATGHEECFQLLKEHDIGCVVTDYEMPEVTGPELCKKIKEHQDYKDIAVILLTSKDAKKYLLEAINSGADDFISKSIDPEIIANKVKVAIRNRNLNKKAMEFERLRTVHAMIATYNHEINNPLFVAMTMLGDNLKDLDEEKFEKAKLSLKRIDEVVKKIDEFVNGDVQFGDYTSDTEMIKLDS